MDVHMACENCETEIVFRTGSSLPEECPDCGVDLELYQDFHDGDRLEHCLYCGGEDFYESKQINPNFGISMVGIGTALFLGSVFFIPGMDGFLWGMIVLLSLAVFDRVLRMLLPEAVICYQCSSVYKDVNPDQDFGEFDHELATELKFSD